MNIVITFIFYIYFCIVNANEDGVLTIPLKRMKSPLAKLGLISSGTKLLETLDMRFEELRKNTTNASVPLFKYLDSEFYGEVLIGHPGQKMNMIFDTSWPNSWVTSILCPLKNLACAMHNKYDSSRSSQYVPNGKKITFTAGGKNYSGMLSTDLFHIGQVNVTNQTFAEIIDLPWIYMFTKADGIVGLAFSNNAFDKVTPVFYNMVKQGVVKSQIFSFYMNRDPSTSNGGTLFLGGVQKNHYKGNFTFAPVTKADYWQFHMDGIFVKGKPTSFCQGGCETIADTSTNVIEGPDEEIILLNQYIGARKFYFGRYIVDCGSMGKLPAITFSISGQPFILKSRDYIQKITWGGVMLCISSFTQSEVPASKGKMWTLGGAFLSRYYVQFDLIEEKVGFAEALL